MYKGLRAVARPWPVPTDHLTIASLAPLQEAGNDGAADHHPGMMVQIFDHILSDFKQCVSCLLVEVQKISGLEWCRVFWVGVTTRLAQRKTGAHTLIARPAHTSRKSYLGGLQMVAVQYFPILKGEYLCHMLGKADLNISRLKMRFELGFNSSKSGEKNMYFTCKGRQSKVQGNVSIISKIF